MDVNKIDTYLLKHLFETDQFNYLKKNKTKIIKHNKIEWYYLSTIKVSERIIELFKEKFIPKILIVKKRLSQSFIEVYPEFVDGDQEKKLIVRYIPLTKGYIADNKEILDWKYIVKYQDSICNASDMSFVETHISYIDKDLLIKNREVSEDWIESYYSDLDPEIISRYHTCSQSFMDSHMEDLNFTSLLVGGSINTEELFLRYDNKLNINMALQYIKFSSEFLIENWYKLNNERIARYQNLCDSIITSKKNELDWHLLSKYQYQASEDIFKDNISSVVLCSLLRYKTDLSEEFLQYLIDQSLLSDNLIRVLCRHQTLSESFIITNESKLDIDYVCMHQTLTNTTLLDDEWFNKRMNMDIVCKHQELNNAFLTDNRNLLRLNYKTISKEQILDETFMREWFFKLDKSFLCIYQTLSSTFLVKYFGKIDRIAICKYQTLTETFIDEHKEMLNTDFILKYQTTLSTEFKTTLTTWYGNI